jgi:LacI family purine nucleotide synthesis repressor
MPNIKDVAHAAGISPTTVSLILNNRASEKRISSQTVERVLKVTQELGYRPNINARRLRTRDAGKLTVAFYWPLDYRSNMLGSFLAGMQKVIQRQARECEIIVQPYESDRLEKYSSPIKKNVFDGILIGAMSHQDKEYVESLSPQTPILLFNRVSEKYSTVGVDNFKVGFQAASLLQRKGYRDTAVLMAEHPYLATAVRIAAFLDACEQVEIAVPSRWMIKGSNTIAGGAIAMEGYCAMGERPKILFCESDSMAQGALYTLHKWGIRVPEDMELLTISTQVEEAMEYLVPAVSTVSLPTDKMAKIAISTLINKIAIGDLTPVHILVESVIYLRESFRL